jgi:S-adenosylmethionine:tRNA ribosyltransferase-isomerase
VLCRPARKLKPGEVVYFDNKRLIATVRHYSGMGEREVEFECPDIFAWLDKIGEVPLPPYILQRRREMAAECRRAGTRRPVFPDSEDAERYQTVYAREPGSVAAPTAGLHFTNDLLRDLRDQGVEQAAITLHVGTGTFKPVETEQVEDHSMHVEHFTITPATVAAVNAAVSDRRRVVAVGTTSVRALETIADEHGLVHAGHFDTQLMIIPGYRFKSVAALLTNFHLPRSTLLMLVCAFAGTDFVLAAYEEAIRERYRFYSYGDAMLIL